MDTQGLKVTMPNGVCCASIQYGCAECRHDNKTEFNTECKVNPMTTVMLILSGRSRCPLRDMSDKEIEEWKNSKEDGKQGN